MKYLFIISLLTLSTPALAEQEFTKKMFEEAVRTLNEKGVHKLTEDEIYKGALRGVLEAIELKDNPNKHYTWHDKGNALLDPVMDEELDQNLKSEIYGVGIEFNSIKKGDSFTKVLKVFDGGAKDAGIKAGDFLVKVGDKPLTEFKDTGEMANAIRGPEGSRIQLTFMRNGNMKSYRIERRKIKYDTASHETLEGPIGYIEIRYFAKPTPEYISNAIAEFKSAGIKSLVIDLRPCGGGYTPAGKEISKMFAKKGQITFGLKLANGDYDMVKADKNGIASDMKVAVLVGSKTDGTAVALARALKHLRKAPIIGATTGSKGARQEIFEFKNGYSALFTTAMFIDEDKKTWNGTPLQPDIEFPVLEQESEKDMILESAKKILTSK